MTWVVEVVIWRKKTLSQQDCDSNNSDISSEYGYIKSHTISQCEYSSTFKDMNGDVENVDVRSGYGSMKIHTD